MYLYSSKMIVLVIHVRRTMRVRGAFDYLNIIFFICTFVFMVFMFVFAKLSVS